VNVKKVVEKELKNEDIMENAGGNANNDGDKYKDASLNFWGRTLAKKDIRNFAKAQKKGDVELMRKILEIPVGKVMPGMELLGDGTAGAKQ
jgi:hypothetical protein